MAIIKCKMCGGDLVLTEGQFVAECEYCGSKQTVPAADNEKKLTLFARANRLRAACEFDKAAGIYETIVADFPEEAEAYWGLVLCKYGIEYVDDPATGKKIPTCHRSSFDSVMDDGNFEQAMENADQVALRIYRQEAKQIEEIRKGILKVSSSEKPYDIFICYKETDENGDRTVDSLLAQDIYDALISKGYRVFFSRITLEDKLGQAYEPYIFAALNSAKIMLAVGTCYEHYNAVWVKNEWSRYLKIIAQDKNKYLIPCYKNIDAYDIPKEFAHLQGQDMSKVGAIPDLLRGIEKLIPRQKSDTVIVQESVVVGNAGGNNKIASLLDRGNMALEDGDWAKADSFFEDVLNNDSKNAQAYLGKTLAQEKCRTMDALIRKRRDVYQKVGSEELYIKEKTDHISEMANKYSLHGYVHPDSIRKLYVFDLVYSSEVSGRQTQYREEENWWQNHRWLSRAEKFASGAVAQTIQNEKKHLFDQLNDRVKKAQEADVRAVAKLEAAYDAHIAEADKQAEKIYNDGLYSREANYRGWLEQAKKETNPYVLKNLVENFTRLGDYQDSKNLAEHCRKRAAEEQVRVDAENERQRVIAEQERKVKQKKKRMKAVVSAAAILLTVATVFVVTKVIIPEQTYKRAIALRDSGDYMGAVRTFREIPYYKDVKEQLEDFKIVYTKESYVSDDYKYAYDTTYEYDARGNLIAEVKIDDDGDEERHTYRYKYDEKGRLVSKEEFTPALFKITYTYSYDEKGNLISAIRRYDDGGCTSNTYAYDHNGNLVSDVYIDSDGDETKHTYTYDESGNLVWEKEERSSYDYNITEYTYDQNGNLVSEECVDEDGYVKEYANYTYDKNSNVLSEIGHYYTNNHERTFTYDKIGNLIQEVYTDLGWDGEYDAYFDDKRTTSYSYDNNGNLIRENYDGSIYEYSDYLAYYCPKDAK